MIATEGGQFILSEHWPVWLLACGAAVGVGGWVMLYRFGRQLGGNGKNTNLIHNAGGLVTAAVRIALAFGGVWLVFVVLGRIFLLTTNWPIWPMALAGVLLAEAMLWLYELERRIVP
ncbi:MAG: hypothetical protein SVV80_09195, partial [Planctomycetota bacterium]|nr:hypothetical protein [Planctomycetota bacterium]